MLKKPIGVLNITLRFGTIVGPSPGMRFHTLNKHAGLDRPFWKTVFSISTISLN